MAKLCEIYVCKICGNIFEVVEAGDGEPSCCDQEMVLQHENTTDGAKEKHVPVVSIEGNRATVRVGSVAHPMTKEHYIMWIEIRQGDKLQRARLQPGVEPIAVFDIVEGLPITAREYCNLHGLWIGE